MKAVKARRNSSASNWKEGSHKGALMNSRFSLLKLISKQLSLLSTRRQLCSKLPLIQTLTSCAFCWLTAKVSLKSKIHVKCSSAVNRMKPLTIKKPAKEQRTSFHFCTKERRTGSDRPRFWRFARPCQCHSWPTQCGALGYPPRWKRGRIAWSGFLPCLGLTCRSPSKRDPRKEETRRYSLQFQNRCNKQKTSRHRAYHPVLAECTTTTTYHGDTGGRASYVGYPNSNLVNILGLSMARRHKHQERN